MSLKTEVNPDIRELTNDELDAVGGGSVIFPIIQIAALVKQGIDALVPILVENRKLVVTLLGPVAGRV